MHLTHRSVELSMFTAISPGRCIVTTHTQEMQVLAKKHETVPRRARPTRYRTNLIRFAFLVPAILYLLLFFGYPLYYSFSVSFERYDLQAEVTGSGPFIGLGNYI